MALCSVGVSWSMLCVSALYSGLFTLCTVLSARCSMRWDLCSVLYDRFLARCRFCLLRLLCIVFLCSVLGTGCSVLWAPCSVFSVLDVVFCGRL